MLPYEQCLHGLNSALPKTIPFEVVCGDEHYQYVHPVKQAKVKQLVEDLLRLDHDRKITKIILFGSSLRFNCSSYSDIDLLVLGEFDYFNIPFHLSDYGKIDLLAYNEAEFQQLLPETKVFQKALQEGLILYEQLLCIG